MVETTKRLKVTKGELIISNSLEIMDDYLLRGAPRKTKKLVSLRVVRCFNLKTHEELKKFAFLKNCIYLIHSRGWQKGPPWYSKG